MVLEKALRSTADRKKWKATVNKAVIDRGLRPTPVLPPGRLGSQFKRPKSSPLSPLTYSWLAITAHSFFIAKTKAVCALRFSWAATSSNLGL